jgi:hypothetical protein
MSCTWSSHALLLGLLRTVKIDPRTIRGVWSVPLPRTSKKPTVLLVTVCHNTPVTVIALHIVVIMN